MSQIVRMIGKSSVDKVTSVRYSAAYPTGAERFAVFGGKLLCEQ